MFRHFIIFLIIVLNFMFAAGQDSISPRPKVGLVLSGGAAKGIAHIGVLKVLEEAGLPIDYIGGTSMGAIIGGLYAAGYSADELEKLATTRDWDKLLTDAVQRKELSIEEKPDHDQFILSIPFRERKLSIPTGVIYGQNIENLFNTLCAPVYYIRDFNQLPIPYLSVAVDLVTGEQVVFHEGYLPEAIRSSMAIPTMFSAVEYKDKLLVDGGLINNFPVAEVKEMGADILVGVYVGRVRYTKEEIDDLFKVFDQTIFLASQYTSQENQDLCDLIIRPDMTNYGSSSFNSADSLIILGEQAARQLYPDIKKLADSLNNLAGQTYEPSSVDRVDSILIREIHVNGLEKVSRKLIDGKLQLKTLEKYSPEDISQAINRTYSSLYFDKVTWELEGIPGDTASRSARLIVNVKEKKGIDLRLGLNYNSDFNASLVFNGVVRNILLNGSRFSTTFSLGENPFLHISFFKNNGGKPGFGLDIYGEDYDLLYYNGNQLTSKVRFSDLSFRLYTQSIVSNSYTLGGGIEYETLQLRPGLGDIIWNRQSTELYNLFGFIRIDTYDDLFYPTTGQRFVCMYKFINKENTAPIHFLTFRFNSAIPLTGKATLIPSLKGGFTTADSTLSPYLIYMGGMNQRARNGILPFVGLDFMQKANRYAAAFSLDLQYNIWRNNYLILKTNLGTTSWDFSDIVEKENGFFGFGITLGNNSPIGPIEFTLMGSNLSKYLITYVNIGYWF